MISKCPFCGQDVSWSFCANIEYSVFSARLGCLKCNVGTDFIIAPKLGDYTLTEIAWEKLVEEMQKTGVKKNLFTRDFEAVMQDGPHSKGYKKK